jgi:excisionase family DNA binding protein
VSRSEIAASAEGAVAPSLPDPKTEPVLSVTRAADLLGLSRGSAYEAVRRGEIPSLRFNRRVVVPTAPLLAMLGVEDV